MPTYALVEKNRKSTKNAQNLAGRETLMNRNGVIWCASRGVSPIWCALAVACLVMVCFGFASSHAIPAERWH